MVRAAEHRQAPSLHVITAVGMDNVHTPTRVDELRHISVDTPLIWQDP
jgi:hypothetical protein